MLLNLFASNTNHISKVIVTNSISKYNLGISIVVLRATQA